MNTNLAEYKNLYLRTAKAYITDMQINIAKLTTNRQDIEAIKQTHLAAHSLKSQSLIMGYTQTGILSELLEKLFYSCKMQQQELSQDLLHTIAQVTKQLEASMRDIEKNDTEGDLSTAIKSFEKITKMKAAV